MKRLTEREACGLPVCSEEALEKCNGKCSECDYNYECFKRLADYEDTGLTPEEFRESIDFTLKLNAKLRDVIKDLKYYFDTNEENGVVYVPKFVIEKMINEHLKTNFYCLAV